MKFRIDLHTHSKFSGDNYSEPEDYIMQALKLNLDGIAFTEHYYYEASEPIEKLIEKYRGMIQIFRGVEVSSAEGHCLVFGVNTDKLPIQHLPAQEMIDIVNHGGGVVIPSHPYRRGSSLGDLIMDVQGICAVEGHNGCNMHAMNEKAVKTAQDLMLPYTGGSDAHAPEEVGSCYTEFNEAVTSDNLVEILKSSTYQGIDTRKVSKGIGTFFNW
jgi:predicted metal-dependent phosphoesterase TrpH